MLKRVLLVMLVGVTMILSSIALSAGPASAQYAYFPPTVTGNGPTFGVGDKVELVGHNFKPGTEVTFTITDCGSTQLLGTAVADANGDASFSFTVPAGCCPGTHDVVLIGTDTRSNPATTTYQITVTGNACTPTTAAGNLPRTGSDTGLPIALGLGLVVVGGVLVIVARRRTSARRHNLAG